MFFKNHGENINLSGDTISWTTNTFDGCAVAQPKLQNGVEVEILIDGGLSGGHVVLGVTTNSDEQIKESIRKGTKIDVMAATHIKVFKTQKRFRIEMKSDEILVQEMKDNSNKVTNIPICYDFNYRLCALLLFGHMDVSIIDEKSKKFQWCPSLCGNNVSLSSDKKKASLTNGNPHAVCALSNALVHNEKVGFDVTSVDGANWYYLKCLISTMSPAEAAAQGWEISVNNRLQTLVKIRNPKEQLLIETNGKTINFVTGINSTHSFAIDVFSEDPVYIYFELFRMKLTVKAREDISEYEDSYADSNDVYEKVVQNSGPVLYVKKQGESEKAQKASETLDNLTKMLSTKDKNVSKMSEIYDTIRKFDKDLSCVESQYEEPQSPRKLPQIPRLPPPTYTASIRSLDSGIGSATSACSTPTNKGGAMYDDDKSRGTTDASNTSFYLRPSVYVRSGNEDMKSMIKALKERVASLERKKKITIATSMTINL